MPYDPKVGTPPGPDFDYASDIARFTSNVDAKAVKGIVKHLGIALKSIDSSMVSCSDKGERDRVRDQFLVKKLGLEKDKAELDKIVMAVCEKMKADKSKLRVTFCYLLAEQVGKLGAFAK
ncbi:MAG: DUF2853 family protein [Hyphomicrobiaceae bacterium]|nr:MAG: DUF2853 family protein [Hyphomicrobiaceae bacterium]